MNFYRSILNYGGNSLYAKSYTALAGQTPMQTNLSRYFRTNSSFNAECYIGDQVNDCSRMFEACSTFNSPVKIGKSVVNCSNMFAHCPNLNSNIRTRVGIEDCSHMFYMCLNFNQGVAIPANATNLKNMFSWCRNLNQDFTIVSSAVCSRMFEECSNMGGNIYFNNTPIDVGGMLNAKNLSKRVNIFCNDLTNVSSGAPNWVYLYNSSPINWSTMTNGYYNESLNIYLYNNYVGT